MDTRLGQGPDDELTLRVVLADGRELRVVEMQASGDVVTLRVALEAEWMTEAWGLVRRTFPGATVDLLRLLRPVDDYHQPWRYLFRVTFDQVLEVELDAGWAPVEAATSATCAS